MALNKGHCGSFFKSQLFGTLGSQIRSLQLSIIICYLISIIKADNNLKDKVENKVEDKPDGEVQDKF